MLRNIRIRLSATGLAATVCCWLLCFTGLAIAGGRDYLAYAQGVLSVIGVGLALALTQSLESDREQ